MTFRSSMDCAAVVLVLVLLAGCGGGTVQEADRVMPIVLVTVDGLFAEQLSTFGGQRPTPALDGLAAEGVVWRDGWTASPMSRPAVATYLTGLAPDRHGVRDELFLALPESVPTLATELASKGYRTAAFPNSSLLGYSSGLLRGFETVNDPPLVPIGPHKILPLARPADQIAENFKLWLDELPEGSQYFAWLHFSAPMVEQIESATPGKLELRKRGRMIEERKEERQKAKGEATRTEWQLGKNGKAAAKKGARPVEEERPPALEAFDGAVGRIVDALSARGDLGQALLIVAPTMGDLSGGESDCMGPGFSLAERAIRVPFIVLFPEGIATDIDGERRTWAPDVPATIAQLAGFDLSPDAEGTSLLEEPQAGRTMFSFSWATLDQMGWLALRAARTNGTKLAEGFEETASRLDGAREPVAEEDRAMLRQALLERAEPPAFAVDMEEVRQWLKEHGVEPRPVSASGRKFGPAEKRRQVVELVWRARLASGGKYPFRAVQIHEDILAIDPDCRAAYMEQGQLLALMRSTKSPAILKEAARRYPTDPEVLHWFAHAVWGEPFEDAESLLDILLKYMPHDADVLYDKACARSRSGDVDASVEYLEAAIEAGFTRWNIIESDGDLRELRQSPKYSELMRQYDR